MNEPLPMSINDENLRRVLKKDGFTDVEVKRIFKESSAKVANLRGKKIGLKNDPTGTDPTAEAYLTPWDFLLYWPFIKKENPDFDVRPLLKHILKFAANSDEDWEITTPFARWALFLPSDMRNDAKIRSLVVKAIRNEHYRVGTVADKLIEYFNINPRHLKGIIRDEMEATPLDAVTYLRPQTLPAGFLDRIIKFYFVSGEVWPDLVDAGHQIQIFQHTEKHCGDCEEMFRGHLHTLRFTDSEFYGKTALIRLNGQIVGALKGVGDPSFLALRNMGQGPGEANFIWSGAVYQTTSELVKRARDAIQHGLRFPILDVTELRLKPVSFFAVTNGPPPARWVHDTQKNLNLLLH